MKCSILMFPFSCPPTRSSLLLFHVANSCPVPCKFHLAHHRHSDTYSMYIKLIQIKYQNTGNYIPATIPSKHTPLSCYWLIWILFPGNEEDFPRLKMDFLKENKKWKQLYNKKNEKKKRNFNMCWIKNIIYAICYRVKGHGLLACVVRYYFSLFYFDNLGSAFQLLKLVAEAGKQPAQERL